jgi:hypothetical protein
VGNALKLAKQDIEAREKADPFRTQFANNISEDVRNKLRSEYERALRDPSKSTPDLQWRRFMMDNGKQMTREEYNRNSRYTDRNTNVELEARLKKLESDVSGKGLEDAYKKIEETVNKRFEHRGSYADHYHYDRLLSMALDNSELQLRELIAQADVVDEIAAEDEMTEEVTEDEIAARDANLEARVEKRVKEVQANLQAEIEALKKELAASKRQMVVRSTSPNPEEYTLTPVSPRAPPTLQEEDEVLLPSPVTSLKTKPTSIASL